MKRTQFSVAALVWMSWLYAPVAAQAASAVRVYTQPAGLQFTIDGQTFAGVTDYIWEANSKHVITGFGQYTIGQGTPGGVDPRRYFEWKCWRTNLAPGLCRTDEPITADPNLTWIRLEFIQSNLLKLVLFDCSSYDPQPCPTAGYVRINGVAYDRSAELWILADTQVIAEAYPASGYIFTGWAPFSGQSTPFNAASFIVQFVMSDPQVLQPLFQSARPIPVTLDTNLKCPFPQVTDPCPVLQLYADRTPYFTPVQLEWGRGTVHSVGAPPTQSFRGIVYAFDSWSDGGAINHDVKVPLGYEDFPLVAKYLPAATVSVLTSPSGLAVTVDGSQKYAFPNFIWAAGSSHQISAPATQTDAQGRKYQFVSWSNGKPAAFTYSMSDPPADDTITAKYQPIGQVTLNSVPSGISLKIDDSTCTTPCVLERSTGAALKVTAPASIQTDPNSRLVFQSWNDSVDVSRQIGVSADSRTYTLTYSRQNRLLLVATPPEGASFTVTPSSPDGFYDSSSVVSISARLALGFRMSAWTGDISGLSTTTAVGMDAPKSGTLLLDRVPAISSNSPRNAAAEVAGVVAGSLISVFGVNLAPDTGVAAANPLPQTLQNVTLRVDGSFLPLAFVSPQQINAQLPSSISEGTHTLVLRWEGKGETSIQITVVRNSPGLFNDGNPDQPLGSFLHSNGQPVTPGDPARPAETLTLLGTGFGPYVLAPPDGFAVDESAGYTLADRVSVLIGDDSQLAPDYAGRSAVGAGIDAVRFQLPSSLPDAPLLKIRIRSGDRESNSVLLPVSR